MKDVNRSALVGIGCCGFFGLFGRVLKVVLPNVSPVSVASIFRGQHSGLTGRESLREYIERLVGIVLAYVVYIF